MEKATLITTSKYACEKRYPAKKDGSGCKGRIYIGFNLTGNSDAILKYIEKTLETIKKETTADFKPDGK
jgi:hypothetical protein